MPASVQSWFQPAFLLLICVLALAVAAIAICRCINGKKDVSVKLPSSGQMNHQTPTVAGDQLCPTTDDAEQPGHCSLSEGLAADVSHQIRVALNDIAGFAELLAQEALTPEQARFVEFIVTSADRIRAVLEDMLGGAPAVPDSDRAALRTSPPPAASESSLQADADKGSAAGDNRNYKVLIVDDVPENRMLLDVLLRRQGYTTVQCSSGVQAVELCDGDRFDVILMDIQMADMDGLEATRTIRSRGPNAQTPILALTAAAALEDEERCLNAGFDDCIRKPVAKDRLLRKVQRFIDRGKQIKTAASGGEIISLLSNDPDYQKTIETFVESLPDRISQMQDALDARNLQELALKAHALKGLGGFAGFPVYTELAGSIEQALHDSHLDLIRTKLDYMVALCRRTRLTAQ